MQKVVEFSRFARLIQFRLVTILIAVTVTCLWLGWQTSRARRQRDGVEAIKAWKGDVNYDYQFGYDREGRLTRKFEAQPSGPKWLRDLVGVDYFNSVVSVFVASTYLNADYGPVEQTTPPFVCHLPKMPQLRILSLAYVRLSDDDIVNLGPALRRLEKLELVGMNGNDLVMAQLSGSHNLKELKISEGDISDNGLRHLGALPQLEVLGLSGMRVNDAGLKSLAQLQYLRRLYLDGTQIGDATLAQLSQMGQLAVLHCDNTRVSNEGLKHLKGIRLLSILRLNGNKVDDAGLSSLRSLTNLEWLSLCNTDISDSGLSQLRSLHRLKRLGLSGTNTSVSAIDRLERQLPNCVIEVDSQPSGKQPQGRPEK